VICEQSAELGRVAGPTAPTSSDDASGILLVTEVFPPAIGGSAVLFENIYSRLAGRVVVLTDGTGSAPSGRGEPNGPEIVRRPIAWNHWGILSVQGFQHYRRVASEISSLRPARHAIIHCARAVPEGLAALLAARRRGFRYLCWTLGEEVDYAMTSRELTFTMKRVLAGAAGIITISRRRARMLESLGVHSGKIHVVYPGVDATRFRPDVDGMAIRRKFSASGETLLLSVGRLQRRKGHDLAIAAVAALRASLPGLRYVIVGDGDERSRLEALVLHHGLRDHVTFAGEVAAEDLPGYFAACDIFLLPNRAEGAEVEGFGIVFLEAAAAERPVIGGRSGGVAEAVQDGETGFLVGGDDVHELAAAIRRLATSRETRRRMGVAGRCRVLHGFTWDRAAAAVAELHAQLTTSS